MIQIIFTGTSGTMSKLQSALMGYAIISAYGRGDAHICEVRSGEDLRKIPPKSPIPLFLIIGVQDKEVIERLRMYRIAGIFFPPLDGDAVKRKLIAAIGDKRSNADFRDFGMIKVKIMAKAENIPTLPIFAQRLLTLTNNDATTIREITDQIKMDQGITSRVIRMVNSPFFGLRQDVTSIERAVVLLGFQTVKNIALVAATNTYYGKGFAMYRTSGSDLWTHAYRVALISEILARHCRLDPDSFFLCGLLHDIGKTVMVDFLVQEVFSVEDEQKQLGTDHAEVAGMMLNKWKLPPNLIKAVQSHHSPDSAVETYVVYIANMLSHNINNIEQFSNLIEAFIQRCKPINRDSMIFKINKVISPME